MVSRNWVLTDSAVTEPSKFGLLNSKTLVTVEGGDEHWTGGIAFEALTCNVDSRVVSICNTTEAVSSTEANSGSNYYLPFYIQTEYTCSTFGFEKADYFGKAVRAMELCQGKAAEHEFWTGDLAQLDTSTSNDNPPIGNENKYLASSDAVDKTPTPGTAIKPRHALALLEQALADCGCGTRGFIHATRGVASVLADDLEEEDDTLVTKLGNYVIAGTGYDGSGPNGAIPTGTKAWMYATGPITAVLGKIATTPDERSEALNTRNNEVVVTAERPAAVTWDGCCHFGVLVDLSLDYS